ncbi:MAG: nuclear transport factor 2 family protein [Pseudomonadota bacterium]
MQFALLALLIFSAGISSTAYSQKPPVEDQIAALESKWSGMFGERDLEGVMALMAKDSVLIMPGSKPIVGLEEIRNATKVMLESDDQVSWVSDFAFVSASGDMAYDYGTATTQNPDGSSVQGHYLVVWVKEDGKWKVAADMFN